ncbi:hypothetical protein Tco_0262286 [Tanacetum coccineum]
MPICCPAGFQSNANRLSVLSSRWRFIWTAMPNLNFASHDYEFVNNVLSARNNKIDVSSVSLRLADAWNCEFSVFRIQDLTLKKVEWFVDFVYVGTPQLKNLIFVDTPQQEKYYIRQPEEYYYERIISEFSGELTISAPGLTYLRIKESDLFQRLHSVKSLALSLEIVELLSTSEEVISHQPSLFPSLKSLKIYPLEGVKTLVLRCLRTYWLQSSLEMFLTQLDEEQEAMKRKLSVEVTNYLLGSSSNATFTMVSREEARAIKITTTS